MWAAGQADLPGYEVIDVLGEGGFATVYRAHQLSVQREVALKIDDRVLSSERSRRRFLREVTAAGQLSNHQHVVALYDAGVLGDGRPYMVLELCPGGSLSDRLRTHGSLPVHEARDVGMRIADALAAAHGAGVLHRDVKPGNILVNQFGAVALADFGLAAMPRPGRELSATREALTPAYAPPEAFRLEDPTPLGDVYALGATLYALLSGRPPHYPAVGDLSVTELIVRRTEPLPGLHGIPHSMMAVLRQALAPEPADRMQGAAALRDALAAVELPAARTLPRPRQEGTLPEPVASRTTLQEGSATASTVPERPTAKSTMPLRTTANDATSEGSGRDETDPVPSPRSRRKWRHGRRSAVITLAAALAAAGLGVAAVLAFVDRGDGGDKQNPGGRGAVGAADDAKAGSDFPVATVTKACPAASVSGARARCTTTAECWGGMVVTSGFVTVGRSDCTVSHPWETFAIAPLPKDGMTNNQRELVRHPLVRKLCSREVMAKSRAGAAKKIAAKAWTVDVLPPSQAEFDKGSRNFRCVATVTGKESTRSNFRPRT
jgi:serine/threonine protein kinase